MINADALAEVLVGVRAEDLSARLTDAFDLIPLL
jgi:hypothetical protein